MAIASSTIPIRSSSTTLVPPITTTTSTSSSRSSTSSIASSRSSTVASSSSTSTPSFIPTPTAASVTIRDSDAPLNGNTDPKSTIALIAIVSIVAAVVFTALLLLAFHRCCRRRRKAKSSPTVVEESRYGGSMHRSLQGPDDLTGREGTPIRPNGEPRDLRSWIHGMSVAITEDTSTEASPPPSAGPTSNEGLQKSSSFRVTRKPLPPYTPYSSSLHTASTHYITAPSTPRNILVSVEQIEEGSVGSSVTMSAPVAPGMQFGSRGRDSVKNDSSPSIPLRASVDLNGSLPSFNARNGHPPNLPYHSSHSVSKRFVTDPLPIPGARSTTGSTTHSLPYEIRRASSELFYAGPNVGPRNDTSPTPSSACLNEQDSEPDRTVLMTSGHFASSVDPSSLAPSSQQPSSYEYATHRPLFPRQHSNLAERHVTFRQPMYDARVGPEAELGRPWPVRTLSDVGSQGVKMGNTASGLPLIHFPSSQDGIRSARGSMHSGNTHSFPHSHSNANLHAYMHASGSVPDIRRTMRQRTLSLPLEKTKREKSRDTIGDSGTESDVPLPVGSEKRRTVKRAGVVRKEVPTHLLAQVERYPVFPSSHPHLPSTAHEAISFPASRTHSRSTPPLPPHKNRRY